MAHLPKGQGIFLPPFKAWLASNIPAVYDNTMSYYEELVALIKYLQDIVVPAVNDNAAAVTTISEALETLQTYVDNYFITLIYRPKSIISLIRWLKAANLQILLHNIFKFKQSLDLTPLQK